MVEVHNLDDTRTVQALVYTANSKNPLFIGAAAIADSEALARRIAVAVGPSGPGKEYLFRLADYLRQVGCYDPSCQARDLERRIKQMQPELVLAVGSLNPVKTNAATQAFKVRCCQIHKSPLDFNAVDWAESISRSRAGGAQGDWHTHTAVPTCETTSRHTACRAAPGERAEWCSRSANG